MVSNCFRDRFSIAIPKPKTSEKNDTMAYL